jgi:hypothetical protein
MRYILQKNISLETLDVIFADGTFVCYIIYTYKKSVLYNLYCIGQISDLGTLAELINRTRIARAIY